MNSIQKLGQRLIIFEFHMDMKKLIDQTDFDNVNELSKRWKKQSHHQSLADSQCILKSQINIQKENISQDSNHEKYATKESNLHGEQQQGKKRLVVPQVIDEDTEQFKSRLENLLNTFKTDAVCEFMSMKRSMLDYQKDCVKSDTQKYLTMYQQKHQELLETKEKLIEVTREAEKKTIQCEFMSNHIAKLNQRIKITRYLSRPFALLYQNKERQKMIKFKFGEAAKADHHRLKVKALNGWRNIFRSSQKERSEQEMSQKIEMEVNEIVGRFQKQMEMVKEKLAEATRKNEQYENSKHMMQQNLKKAFLRGISAMNMQAMGIFTTEDSQGAMSEIQNRDIAQNLSQMDMESTHNHSSQKLNQTTINQTTFNQTTINPQSNSSFIMGKSKVQSKDHKWKQAPILGVEERQDIEEPRPILVKPISEGKVIKVVDGKSAVSNDNLTKKNTMANSVTTYQKVESSSRKKI